MTRHALAVMPAHADVYELTAALDADVALARRRGRRGAGSLFLKAPSRALIGTAR